MFDGLSDSLGKFLSMTFKKNIKPIHVKELKSRFLLMFNQSERHFDIVFLILLFKEGVKEIEKARVGLFSLSIH